MCTQWLVLSIRRKLVRCSWSPEELFFTLSVRLSHPYVCKDQMGWSSLQTCWVWAEHPLSLSFPSNPCHVPDAQWHLSPHASLTSAASVSSVSWLSALCWQVTDKKNMRLFLLSPYPFQKHVSALTKGNRWMPADVSGETGTLSSSVCVRAHKWESFSSQNWFHCTLQLQLSPMSWRLPKYIFLAR